MLLAHATGFHGRCWIPLARVLAPRFSVWALDQRGHGSSARAPGGRYDDWGAFADDILATVDAVGGEGWMAGGHSLGGGVSLLAESRRPGTFRAICCYEPVVMPPPGTAEAGSPGVDLPPLRSNPLAQLARKRRPWFESREAALANYRSKPPFAAFDPEALAAYVEFGFRDDPGGGVTLACEREDEAAVFEGAAGNPAWDGLPAVTAPVAVLSGSDLSDPVARIAPAVARRLPRAGLRVMEGLNHFGPMCDPVAVGTLMLEAFTLALPGGTASTKADTPPG